jgi:predicted Zn-dependent protease
LIAETTPVSNLLIYTLAQTRPIFGHITGYKYWLFSEVLVMTTLPRSWFAGLRTLAVMLGLLVLAGCQTNQATGEQQFTAFMSPAQEQSVGRQEHAKIVADYGVVENPALTAWVSQVGQRVAAATGATDTPFTVTVLDDDVVNAFALPGGFVYVTRGLLALANDEAEVASVLGHEMGHVVGRHSAERYSQSVVASLGIAAVAILTGDRDTAQIAQTGSQLALSSFSREHEYQADALGVRFIARSGYDATASADLLAQLEHDEDLRNRIQGTGGQSAGADFFASHPRAADRVARARQLAQQQPASGDERGREAYLRAVDGMLYGSAPSQGYVRGSTFVHPELGFRFVVPPGFQLKNGHKAVSASDRQGASILFDGDSAQRVGPGGLSDYLRRVWVPDASLRDTEELTINGLPAATATAQAKQNGRQVDLRFVVIRFNTEKLYRFLFITPTNRTAALAEDLQRTTYSFATLSQAERVAIKPRRIAVVTVRAGETLADMARRMDVDALPAETFALINGLDAKATLQAGQRVKLVVSQP